ncbi:pantoate--beta-alanine ligase [Fluviispira multicolorata]|uniref:Pantothenate synthetase n=1 Tax=Fluviispira multicolorata TaxID=2654512 RepID=A0A833N4A8_9BACT|nr:pantoate--beta-alanine ligase [Fluviispira multicolorata]KAB8031836.1 pantoate--beta-alanine ligase [Fluviispira multicolorata]
MSLLVITRKKELISFVAEQKKTRKSIGFVPTMGALHEGHASLVKLSASENDCTLISIFVNPKQFSANEDLSKYPRTFQKDIEVCEKNNGTVLFAPTVEEMYPNHFKTEVKVTEITEVLCGAFRLGHFNGVATVLNLLINLTQADKMYLGQKDFQQVQVVKKMVEDLSLPIKIISCPTIREADGLPLSSRNRFLSPEGRKISSTLPRALAQVAKAFLAGERSVHKLDELCKAELNKEKLIPQYLEFRLTSDLTRKCEDTISEDCVLALAQFIEDAGSKTRLIDNIVLGNDSSQIDALVELIKRALG